MEFQALQSLALRVGEADTTSEVFKCIVDGLSAQSNVALARLWLILPGDLCDSCLMREKCPDRARCLHLVASAGNPRESREDWSRLSGDFQRIPLNAQKVGEFGALGEPILVGSDLAQSRWAARPDWALREAIVGFAGQPLVLRGQILGVLAVFSRAQITQSESNWLRIFADHAAIAIANARAIDALRRVEEKVHLEQANLRRTIDTIPALVSGFLPDGSNEFVNKRWHDYTGLSPEASRHRGWQQAVHPDDLPRVMDKWREVRVTGEPGEIETRLRRHDGSFRWFVYRAEALRDETGKIARWYATSTDIEDRKQAELELRRSESFLLEAQRLSHTGSWRFDVSSETVTVSPEIRRIFGIKPEENSQTAEFFFGRVHPADRPDEERNYARAFSAKADFESDYRLVLPDGTIKHVHNTGHAVLSQRGDLVEFVGTVVDVTEQWQARVKLEKALEEIRRLRDRLHDENLALREEIDHASMFEEIVGSSDAIRHVLGQVSKVAPTDSTVLISGETGTGKELIARAIHKRSNRSARAFICVNCGAIAPSLIASELFGHEKGAFTGAFERRIGHFEAADGGTIFLDEIGDLPLDTQSSLLRVLQERELQRVGSSKPVEVDVRVLAATNRDLRSSVDAGKFREDLFYRLNVFPIRLPPLRQRADDIALLVKYLLRRYAEKAGKRFEHITRKTLDLFQTYHWPGNIRELQNVIERAVILCDGATFSVDESWLRQESGPASGPVVQLVTTLADRERETIEAALAQSKGRISGPTGAANKLGIPRGTLDRKILGLGIDKNRFKTR